MILPIPAIDDNYIWLLQESDTLVIIDPGVSTPVMNWLARHERTPSAILVTHTHQDHIGGVAELVECYPDIEVYAHVNAQGVSATHPVLPGDRFQLGRLSVEVLDLSGHTPDHIGYYVSESQVLFCGDALFAGGCGRLFNGGTAEQMTASLARIAHLPEHTQLYPAHEYTLANLRFAQMVEPNNAELISHLATIVDMRQQGKITLPTLLSTERSVNPFLRTDTPPVYHAIEAWAGQVLTDPVQRFARLRAWKDQIDRTGILELPA